MLNFEKIKNLDTHIDYLDKKIKDKNIFLVGGAIRDLLLWLIDDPKDIDLTMAWEPTKIYKWIDKKDLSHFITEKFGTITLIPKGQKDKEKTQYELTPLRTETKYDDHRHPEEITWSNDLILDSARRDFGINCIYYYSTSLDTKWIKDLDARWVEDKDYTEKDILKSLEKYGIAYLAEMNIFVIQNHEYISQIWKEGKWNTSNFESIVAKLQETIWVTPNKKTKQVGFIIDPHGGIQDLVNRKITAVWDPHNRFKEDALRIIRALRFVSVLNRKFKDIGKETNTKVKLFDIETNTWKSIKKNYYLLQFVAKERIKDELIKVFQKWDSFVLISLLDEINVLKFLFPALHQTKGITQPVRYHPFDVFVHTLLCLYELEKINNNYLAKLAMLYHDVGKVDQYYMHTLGLDREEVRETLGTWINHQVSSIDTAKEEFGKLWFSKKETDEIGWYIQMHHKPGEILDAKKDNRKKKLRKIFSEGWLDKTNTLLDIAIADRLGQYNPMQNSTDISDIHELKDMLQELQEQEGQFTMKDLAINGDDIIKDMKIQAGPEVGKILDKAFNWVLNDIKNKNNKEKIIKFLKK